MNDRGQEKPDEGLDGREPEPHAFGSPWPEQPPVGIPEEPDPDPVGPNVLLASGDARVVQRALERVLKYWDLGAQQRAVLYDGEVRMSALHELVALAVDTLNDAMTAHDTARGER